MPIKDWNEDDKPREKLITKGPEACSVAELIAILITNGTNKKSAVQLGAEIMQNANNNLNTFVRQTIGEYQEVPGIGPAKACIIKAAAELGRRIRLADMGPDICIKNSCQAYELMKDLKDIAHEEFWVIFTSNSGRLIRKFKVAEGGGGQVIVDVGKIIYHAVSVSATRIILCHNHPGGSIKPSNEDIKLTKDIQTVCRVLRISVVEHIIIAGDHFYSFLENSLL